MKEIKEYLVDGKLYEENKVTVYNKTVYELSDLPERISLKVNDESIFFNRVSFRDFIAEVAKEQKISAIKLFRTITSCGLKEAKNTVEHWVENYSL